MSVDKFDAEIALEEQKEKRLNDDHEDTKKFFDPSEIAASHRSSYKKEKRVLLKKYHQAKADLSKQKDLEIASLSGNESSKIDEISNRYAQLEEQLKAEFEEQEKLLKVKYEDEIKYKIHPRLKRKEELINSDILLSVSMFIKANALVSLVNQGVAKPQLVVRLLNFISLPLVQFIIVVTVLALVQDGIKKKLNGLENAFSPL